jgi:hypothetical protein
VLSSGPKMEDSTVLGSESLSKIRKLSRVEEILQTQTTRRNP